ncbi:MAG: hypothetical protein IID38_05825 [Planctomycetes bacterium]|nr:hypothetical protein [Planctomycetota bacterium]
MATRSDNAGGLVVRRNAGTHWKTRSTDENKPTLPRRIGQERFAAPDRSVYLAVRVVLPRWLRILEPTSWMPDMARSRRDRWASPRTLRKQAAAALGIALLCEADRDRPDAPFLRGCVRTSLIRWQLSLRGDGKPASRRLRRDSLHAAVIRSVTLLLRESPCFRNTLLLGDTARHLAWLANRRESSAWLEAGAIAAQADGARLIGDTGLLGRARTRLRDLLTRQDSEGWFPEGGGADAGRLSLTLDALAELYVVHQWDELAQPLQRSLRFLAHVVHPDGTIGGCMDPSDTGFLSPFGVELLADEFPEAAALARICRRRCARLDTDRLQWWSDDVCAVLGSRIAMAAAFVSRRTPRVKQRSSLPSPLHDLETRTDLEPFRGHIRFPRAGLSVFSTDAYHAVVAGRRGGSVHVHWRADGNVLDDSGVTAVFPRTVRANSRFDRYAREEVTPLSVSCTGNLWRIVPESNQLRGRARRFLRVLRQTARF